MLHAHLYLQYTVFVTLIISIAFRLDGRLVISIFRELLWKAYKIEYFLANYSMAKATHASGKTIEINTKYKRKYFFNMEIIKLSLYS